MQFENPTPVAGCLVADPDTHAVVLIRRGISGPGAGAGAIPAGYMEWGETAEESALRETREETGLDARVTALLGVYSYREAAGSGVIIFYVAEQSGGTLQAGDDAQEVGRFAPDTWPDAIAFSTHRRALDDYLTRYVARMSPAPINYRAPGTAVVPGFTSGTPEVQSGQSSGR